jgi:hypothetical protein
VRNVFLFCDDGHREPVAARQVPRSREARWALRLPEVLSGRWQPDGRSGDNPGAPYVPATAPTDNGGEAFGYVSYTREHEGAEAIDFRAVADQRRRLAARAEVSNSIPDGQSMPTSGSS